MPNQPALAWCFVAGSIAPDLDLALRFYDRAAFLRYHQGVTHSLPGMVALMGVSVTVSWLMTGSGAALLAAWWAEGLVRPLVTAAYAHSSVAI